MEPPVKCAVMDSTWESNIRPIIPSIMMVLVNGNVRFVTVGGEGGLRKYCDRPFRTDEQVNEHCKLKHRGLCGLIELFEW